MTEPLDPAKVLAGEVLTGDARSSGPRCYLHPQVGGGHMLGYGDGWPAHIWDPPGTGKCQRCPEQIHPGDLYLCSQDRAGRANGIVHATCPPAALGVLDV